MTTAYMFPGQGSQFSGMGAGLFAQFPQECALADRTLGYSIAQLCLDSDSSRLDQTRYTQPAVFFVSCLDYLHRTSGGLQPDIVLGHSLGLYAALFAAGVITLPLGLEIVARRAALMQEAQDGAMLAVIADQALAVGDLLLQHEYAEVEVANYNSPDQVVLSGPTEKISELQQSLPQAGYDCIRLPVQGAFHSRLMERARIAFMRELLECRFQPPRVPVVSTTSGSRLSTEHLPEELGYQLVRPVRWLQTLRQLAQQHEQLQLIEVGPGQVLGGLARKILGPACVGH